MRCLQNMFWECWLHSQAAFSGHISCFSGLRPMLCAPACLHLQTSDEDIRSGSGVPPPLLWQQQRPTRASSTLLALPIASVGACRALPAAPINAQLLACCAGSGLHCQGDGGRLGHLEQHNSGTTCHHFTGCWVSRNMTCASILLCYRQAQLQCWRYPPITTLASGHQQVSVQVMTCVNHAELCHMKQHCQCGRLEGHVS